MLSSDPVDIQLEHDAWATRNLIEACARLTREQFHQPFEMGPGSLHDATTHIVAAMVFWENVLEDRELTNWLEDEPQERTPAELLALHEKIAADFAAVAHKHPLDEFISRVYKGKTYTYTCGIVITHVTTHGMHHRAQCLNMLRQLGVDPLPKSSVTEWCRAVDRIR